MSNLDFTGLTKDDCAASCRAERCCISTVAVCAHPHKTAPNGFGPVTLANREMARDFIDHQKVKK